MYASLIGAGVSQLWDLFGGQTNKSGNTDTSFQPSSSDGTPSSTAATGSSGSGQANAVGGIGAGGKLSSDLNSLLLDVQSASNGSAGSGASDPTATVAGDLQKVFGDIGKAGGAHGHHHHAPASGASSSTTATSGTSQGANPFSDLASSLIAYAKGQNLGVGSAASTSLTA